MFNKNLMLAIARMVTPLAASLALTAVRPCLRRNQISGLIGPMAPCARNREFLG